MAFEYPIRIPFAAQRKTLNETITMEDLKAVSDPIITEAIAPIKEALTKAHLQPKDIDLIILAGGSSQLPGVAQKIKEMLGKSPRQVPKNLMLAVAYGAALYQKETLSLPSARKQKRIVGDSLGIQVQEAGRRQYKLLMMHNQELPAVAEFPFYLNDGQHDATIRLVTMESDIDKKKQELKARTLSLKESTQEIMVRIEVDENRLIQLHAYNPQNKDENVKLEVSRKELDERRIKEIQKELGIIIETEAGATVSGAHEMCIGIDLGTTTSELAWVYREKGNDDPHAMENSDKIESSGYAPYCYPSIVFFRDIQHGSIEIANNAAVDAMSSADVQDKVFSSFKTIKQYKPLGTIDGKDITVRDLSAYVLNKIWTDAAKKFGTPPCSAVITIPAAFDIDQCESTYNAAKLAGIQQVTLLDEPTAAYYYYTHTQQIDTSKIKNVLVFDFGGGTADVAILDVQSQGRKIHEHRECEYSICATSGNPKCGGKDIDEALFELIKKRFEEKNGCSLAMPAQRRLRIEVEKAKVELSEHYDDEE